MNRRDFLKSSAALGAGVSLSAFSSLTRLPLLGASPVKAAGAVRWGALAMPKGAQDHIAALTELESIAGRTFAAVHHRFGWRGSPVNNFTEWIAAGGRMPLITWFTRLSGGPSGDAVSWRSIARGRHDRRLRKEAAAVKAAGWPAYFAWHKEPERESAGGRREYRRAYDHVHDVFDDVGVTNLTWMVTLTASTYNGKHGGADAWLPRRYDVLGVDGYNRWVYNNMPWKSFETIFTGARNVAIAKGKPLFVNEYGSVEGRQPHWKGQWFADAATTLQSWPEVIGVSYNHELSGRAYDSNGLRYWVDTSAESADGFRNMGQQPHLQM